MKKYKKKLRLLEGSVHYVAEKQDFWAWYVATAIKTTVMPIEYRNNINAKLILLKLRKSKEENSSKEQLQNTKVKSPKYDWYAVQIILFFVYSFIPYLRFFILLFFSNLSFIDLGREI